MLSYSGIKNWNSMPSARQLAAAHVLRKGKRQGCSGRRELLCVAGSPCPCRLAAWAATAGREHCNFTCFEFVDNFLIWRRELWWQGLFWRSCGKEQRAPHGDPDSRRTWGPCSLAHDALTPHCTCPSLTCDTILLQSSMQREI